MIELLIAAMMSLWSAEQDTAYLIAYAAAQQQVTDPVLLVAVARAESSLTLNARGAAGEFGPWQLLPVTRAGFKTAASGIRSKCRTLQRRACLAEQARHAAVMLVAGYAQCGSWTGAFRAYNTGGECAPSKYTHRVMEEYVKLHHWLASNHALPWCYK